MRDRYSGGMPPEARRHPRVSRPGAIGTDPAPQADDDDPHRTWEETDAAWGGGTRSSGENDEQLRRDVPPHWG